MPEGDTIYRAAATLQRALGGRIITRFATAYAHLARVDDDHPIAGRTMESVRSAGKHVLMHLSGGLVLRTHMRMHGSWHIYRPGEPWQRPAAAMRILIETAEWIAVAFDVPVAEFVTVPDLSRRSAVAALGPDLLGGTFDTAAAIARMQARANEPIAEVLLDQRVVAGVGNVFKSETLFVARLHPDTRVRDLDTDTLQGLLAHARRLLQLNVRPSSREGIVTYGGLRRTTGRGQPGDALWVYGRRGKPCRVCGTAIERRKTGPHARSTYWCPVCQPRRT